MMILRFTVCNIVALILGIASTKNVAVVAAADTVLDEQFCQVYFTLEDEIEDADEPMDVTGGSGGRCSRLRSKVRSEIRGNGIRTLEMGNKDTQPAMVFIHGWPDTSALWANQFDRFCGEEKEFFCVAPSWIDYHPDRPLKQLEDGTDHLKWSHQRDEFYAVIKDLGLTDITYVIFDFGVLVGSQLLHFYPELFSKVIVMDIPMIFGEDNQGIIVKDPPPSVDELLLYQKFNIESYLNKKDGTMVANLKVNLRDKAPCKSCKIAPNASDGIGFQTGWPYYNFIRKEPEPWYKDGFDGIPYKDWELSLIPSFPKDVPVLYLWASDAFQDRKWFDWILNKRSKDRISTHLRIPDSDHWMMTRQPKYVNDLMASWLFPKESDKIERGILPKTGTDEL